MSSVTRPLRGRAVRCGPVGRDAVRPGVVAAVALVVLCLVTGCFALAPTPLTDTSSRAATVPVVDIAPVPREDLAPGRQLRIAVASLPDQWNPWHVQGAFDSLRPIIDAASPRFFTTDADGNWHADPNFLAGEPVAAGTPLVVRLRLNPKAVWSDGTPITWADVKAPIEACRNQQLPCADGVGATHVASVTRGRDDFEAVVRFRGAYGQWREALQAPGRATLLSEPNSFAWPAPDLRGQAGPYVVDRYDPATRQVRLVPNPRWWGPAPALTAIVFRSLTADEAIAAFVNNEIDVLPAELDRAATERVRGVVDATLRQAAGPDQRTVLVNADRGALAEVAVRQAVLAAADREAIRRSDLAGLEVSGIAWPAASHGNRLLLPHRAGYRDNSDATGPARNLDGARTLLEKAGWLPGPDGVRVRGNQRLSLNYVTDGGSAVSGADAAALAVQLRAVGIDVQVETVPTADFSDRLVTGRYGLATATLPARVDGAQLYASTSRSNLSRVTLPALDEQLTAMMVAADDQQRSAAANRADRLLWEQAVSIPLYLVPQNVAVRRNVANYGAFGAASVDWTLVGFRS